MLQGCRLFKQCGNLPAGPYIAKVQAVSAVLEPTCPDTVLQWCSLIKWFRNLRAGHCVAGCLIGVETYLPGTVFQVAGCLSGVKTFLSGHFGAGVQVILAVSGTYLPCTVGQVCICFSYVGTYLQGTVGQGCKLFKRCLNLPAGHCVAGVQAV